MCNGKNGRLRHDASLSDRIKIALLLASPNHQPNRSSEKHCTIPWEKARNVAVPVAAASPMGPAGVGQIMHFMQKGDVRNWKNELPKAMYRRRNVVARR